MKYCKRCNIKIASELKYCPLCYSNVTELRGNVSTQSLCHEVTPVKAVQSNVYGTVAKVFALLTVIATLSCILPDYLTNNSLSWSIYVVLSEAYMWILVAHTVLSHRTIFQKVLLQILGIFAILGYSSLEGSGSWLILYSYPAISLGVVASLIIMTLVSPRRRNYFFGFTVIFLILGLISVLFLIIGLVKRDPALNVINVAVCGVSVFAYLLFWGKEIRIDFQKKMHL